MPDVKFDLDTSRPMVEVSINGCYWKVPAVDTIYAKDGGATVAFSRYNTLRIADGYKVTVRPYFLQSSYSMQYDLKVIRKDP